MDQESADAPGVGFLDRQPVLNPVRTIRPDVRPGATDANRATAVGAILGALRVCGGHHGLDELRREIPAQCLAQRLVTPGRVVFDWRALDVRRALRLARAGACLVRPF